MQKPSERLEEFKKDNQVRYSNFSDDEISIATLLNMMDMVGKMLDELDEKIGKP